MAQPAALRYHTYMMRKKKIKKLTSEIKRLRTQTRKKPRKPKATRKKKRRY